MLASRQAASEDGLHRAPEQQYSVAAALVIILAMAAAYPFFAAQPVIPDLGWLIEASRRWIAGAELYRDIIEVNPPLIFYETVALSGGLLTPRSYLAGVSIALVLSSLWVLRLRGAYPALASFAAMLVGGLTDFSQRDHLALIFVIPMLLGDKASRKERIALGLWAFLGLGLKPYFLLIPFAAAITRAIVERDLRRLFSAEMVTLGIACFAYLCLIALFHYPYLSEIVPLARFVYWVYGSPLYPHFIALSAGLTILSSIPLFARDRERLPLASATLAALGSFYLQGRGWSYHFIPAIGLGILLSLLIARDKRVAAVLAAQLCIVQIGRGPYRSEPEHKIPTNLGTVAVLSSDVWPAYPVGLEVRNATRYPSLWIVPGARRIYNDERQSSANRIHAARILSRERRIIRNDLFRERPNAVFADTRGFDYLAYLGPLPGYRHAGRYWIYDVWVPVG